jgi:hypothetical protein
MCTYKLMRLQTEAIVFCGVLVSTIFLPQEAIARSCKPLGN